MTPGAATPLPRPISLDRGWAPAATVKSIQKGALTYLLSQRQAQSPFVQTQLPWALQLARLMQTAF